VAAAWLRELRPSAAACMVRNRGLAQGDPSEKGALKAHKAIASIGELSISVPERSLESKRLTV